jgi:hypothetical protein
VAARGAAVFLARDAAAAVARCAFLLLGTMLLARGALFVLARGRVA